MICCEPKSVYTNFAKMCLAFVMRFEVVELEVTKAYGLSDFLRSIVLRVVRMRAISHQLAS